MEGPTSIEAVAVVATKALREIARRWRLTEHNQATILGVSSTFELKQLQSGDTTEIPADVMARLSLIVGIFTAIHTLLPVPERADAWMRSLIRPPFSTAKARWSECFRAS